MIPCPRLLRKIPHDLDRYQKNFDDAHWTKIGIKKNKGTQRARAEYCPISTTFPLFYYLSMKTRRARAENCPIITTFPLFYNILNASSRLINWYHVRDYSAKYIMTSTGINKFWWRTLDWNLQNKGTQRARAENCPISTTFPLFYYIYVYSFSINIHLSIIKIHSLMSCQRLLRKIHHDPDRYQMNIDDAHYAEIFT